MQFDGVELLLDDFVKSLKKLAASHTIKIKDMSPELKDAYELVKTHVTYLHMGPGYKVVKQHISKLTKPNLIEPGTIGAYIWGCVQECYGDVEKNCTPLCINSIPSETDEIPNCQHHIVTRDILEDGEIRLTCLNCDRHNKNLIHTAILYNNSDIDTLTGQEIEYLKKLGISQLSIMIKDGYKYHQKVDMIPIDRLMSSNPQTSIPKGFIQSPINVRQDEEPAKKSNTTMTIMLIILLIILFVFIIYNFM